ncbi:hypothetical protein Hanom_Chr14g01331501 [Helianthus anomalus]
MYCKEYITETSPDECCSTSTSLLPTRTPFVWFASQLVKSLENLQVVSLTVQSPIFPSNCKSLKDSVI